MSWFIIIQDFVELVACIAGFLCWRKIRQSYWRWFPVYLAVIVLTEVAGEYALKVDLAINVAIYKYWGIPIQFLFFYWLFHQHFNVKIKNRWPLFSAAIYLVCLLSDIFSWPGAMYTNVSKSGFLATSYAVGTILLLILSLIYFVKFVKSDEAISFRSDMMFSVALGLMLFYMLTLPFYMLRTFLYYNYRTVFDIYWRAQYFLDYLMYLMFAVAFIWGRVKQIRNKEQKIRNKKVG